MKNADALFAESEQLGVPTDPATGSRLAEPTDTDYGVRTFAVIDPSGNQVRFGTGSY